MDINFHVTLHVDGPLKHLLVLLQHISKSQEKIMTSMQQHAADLRAVKDQLDKAKAEIVAKVAALEQAIADGGVTSPEVDAALADLKGVSQGLDDLNTDVIVEQPV